jgi:Protein of unknown function (DUF2442)
MHTVARVEVLRPYVLAVTFEDGARREVDVEPLLTGEMFAPLRDRQLFGQVTVDPVLGTVVWPNGADLSPEFLYESRPGPVAHPRG